MAQPGIPSHIGKLVLGTGIGAVGDNQLDTIRAAAACQLQHGSSAHRHPVEYHGNILPKTGSQVLDPTEHILALIVIKAHILATGGTGAHMVAAKETIAQVVVVLNKSMRVHRVIRMEPVGAEHNHLGVTLRRQIIPRSRSPRSEVMVQFSTGWVLTQSVYFWRQASAIA